MKYYYIFLISMLSTNVNCFITRGNPTFNKVHNFDNVYSTKAMVGEYLSYISTAPPFVSVAEVSRASATPPKTSTEYLLYLSLIHI